jgi:PAS domain S-box-containing protein
MREVNEVGRRVAASYESEEWGRRGLQALPAHVAVVDEAGIITLVNRSWVLFACENGATEETQVGVGANYLEICRRLAAASGDADIAEVAAGISSVLSGQAPQFSIEYPCDSPTEPRWFLMNVARLGPDGPAGAIISHLDITPRKQAELAKSLSEARFRALVDNAAVGIAEIDRDGRWLRVNAALIRLSGFSAEDLLARTMQEITHAEDVDADLAHYEVLRSGASDACTLEKRLVRPDGSEVWVSLSLSCVRAPDGSVAHFVAVIEDISERKLAEQRQQTMMHELAHRGRNLLAVIQSLAHRSLAGDRPLKEAREAFEGRVQALAKTYGALTHEAFDGALLDAVLNNELSAFAARARLEGPSVILTVKAAQTFGLVAHELATNALKHGALSVPDGQLRVTWQIFETVSGPTLKFEWREQFGPPAKQPKKGGFGTTLLARIAGAEFSCPPELIYNEQGFCYRFQASLARLGAVMALTPVRRKLKGQILCALYDTWSRLRGPSGELPLLANFDWTKFAATGALTIAKIDEGGAVSFVEVGRTLLGELGRTLTDQDILGEDGAGLAEVYRQCALKREPTHEFLRFDFGDDEPMTFERLLAPFSANGGRTVTHVVGIALFEGHTTPKGRGVNPGALP